MQCTDNEFSRDTITQEREESYLLVFKTLKPTYLKKESL